MNSEAELIVGFSKLFKNAIMTTTTPKPTHSNLFPEPKNTKPRTRVRVFKERHTPDPSHHNYNREQNFNQKLSSTLAWLKLQCDGAAANLNSAAIISLKRLPKSHLDQLPLKDKDKLTQIMNISIHLVDECKSLSELLAEFNRGKTKLTKEQMGIPNKK